MIYGRKQKQEGTDNIWDYVACLYPEGNIDPTKSYMFNDNQIERVYFIGFQDTEEFEFQKYLEEKLG
jgi:hypothetical protein